jgi:integrase
MTKRDLGHRGLKKGGDSTEKPPSVITISKQTVDSAKPSAVRYILWDQRLKGFGLRVEPSGAKSYLIRYRAGGGRRGVLRQFKIGAHGRLTPDQARKEAARRLAEAELGGDPQAVRVAKRYELTVSELCDLYLREGVDGKKPSTLKLDKIRIERHVKPRLGRLPIGEVRLEDVQRLVRDVAAGRIKGEATPHTRGGPGAAARTAGLLGAIFAFAVKRRLRSDNPVRGVTRPKDRKRERLLSPKEFAQLGDALAAAKDAGASPHHVAIVRLLALTGARKNEIARLTWGEVDLDRGRLDLSDSKTGEKVIRLGSAALEVLREAPRAHAKWVFPDPIHKDEPIRGLDWFWVIVRKRAGLPDVRIHDLRHGFASAGLASGEGLPLIGKLLGHQHVATTARYAHLADDPVRAAADRISRSIAGAMDGKSASIDGVPE